MSQFCVNVCAGVGVCLWATGHVLRGKHNEADWTQWTRHADGLHCGFQTVTEAPKICIPDLRSRSRWGIKAWKWDLFSTPHQKGISRVWGGSTGCCLELS